MNATPELSKRIGELTRKYASVEKQLPACKAVDEYDALLKQLHAIDDELTTLLAEREIARWSHAAETN